MNKTTIRPGERMVDLKGLDVSGLDVDKILVNRFVTSYKHDSDPRVYPLTEKTETTVRRLLLQIDALLTNFKERQDGPGRSLALQGLCLLGQDILLFAREAASTTVGIVDHVDGNGGSR